MRLRILLILTGSMLLSACGGTGAGKVASANVKPRSVAGTPPSAVRQPIRRPMPQAQVLSLPGLEGVIGLSPAELTRQFGPARLDVLEGDARKLQFTGTACVLDIYLYPQAQGRDPQATYVDARRSDGKDVDRAACVNALRKR